MKLIVLALIILSLLVWYVDAYLGLRVVGVFRFSDYGVMGKSIGFRRTLPGWIGWTFYPAMKTELAIR